QTRFHAPWLRRSGPISRAPRSSRLRALAPARRSETCGAPVRACSAPFEGVRRGVGRAPVRSGRSPRGADSQPPARILRPAQLRAEPQLRRQRLAAWVSSQPPRPSATAAARQLEAEPPPAIRRALPLAQQHL